jgi:hypothetical protein
MQDKSHQSQPPPATEPVEPRGARLRRHGHRTPLRLGLHPHDGPRAVIALAVANTRQVKLSWVVLTSHASLVWVILVATILSWLLGIATSIVFPLRTRRRRSTEPRS